VVGWGSLFSIFYFLFSICHLSFVICHLSLFVIICHLLFPADSNRSQAWSKNPKHRMTYGK
jgi:hypothetical protein